MQRLRDVCTAELAAEGHAVANKVALGVMIEVPAAALPVGSITRGNDAVAAHSSPLHPAVLRVLRDILQHGNKRSISTSICGEMAGDIAYTRLLLALGLTEFSLHPAHLLEVRRVIRDSHLGELKKRCSHLLRAQDRAGIEAIVAAL